MGAKKFKIKAYHAHGCDQCGKRYTDTCGSPADNGCCVTCRTSGSAQRAIWDRSHDPQPCCRTSSRLVRERTDIEKYALAGPGPWWICRTCSRTSPYDPRVTTTKESS